MRSEKSTGPAEGFRLQQQVLFGVPPSALDGILGIPMLSNLMGQQIKAVTKRRRRLRQLKRKKDAAKLEKKTA